MESVGGWAPPGCNGNLRAELFAILISALFPHHRGSWSVCVSQVSCRAGSAQHPHLCRGQHLPSCGQHHMAEQWAPSHRGRFWNQLPVQEWSFLPQDQLPHLPPFHWWHLWLQGGALGPGWATSETLGCVWVPCVLVPSFLCQIRTSCILAPKLHVPKLVFYTSRISNDRLLFSLNMVQSLCRTNTIPSFPSYTQACELTFYILTSTTSLLQSLRFQLPCQSWQRLWSAPWGWLWASWASWWAPSSLSRACAQVVAPDTKGLCESHSRREGKDSDFLELGCGDAVQEEWKWGEVVDTIEFEKL